MSTLSVGDLQGLAVNSNVVTVPTGHTLNVTDAAGLQIGGSAVVSAGLVLVSETTIGTAVSSVTVSNAFSSTFDNYKVTVEGTTGSVPSNIMIALGSSATGSGYYGSFYYDAYTGGNTGTANSVNEPRLFICASGTLEETFAETTINRPYLAERTQFVSLSYGNGISGWSIGTNAASTSFTSFTFSVLVGTLTGGTIRVYGYAKA